jgi:hypothetical protein
MVTRRGMAAPVDNGRNCFGLGSSFDVANAKFASNGYIYGTGPMMTMKRGERVRPYLVTLGERFGVCTLDIGTARWLQGGKRADVIELMQAHDGDGGQVPDDPIYGCVSAP